MATLVCQPGKSLRLLPRAPELPTCKPLNIPDCNMAAVLTLKNLNSALRKEGNPVVCYHMDEP